MKPEMMSLEQAIDIMTKFGYESLTSLQEMTFSNCAYKQGAREFIIGKTSSGKTLIPLVAFEADDSYEKKMLYIVPYRALATQKYQDFKKIYKDNKDILISTSEYCSSDRAIIFAECDIAIVIYEKVYVFLSKYGKQFLNKYSYVVFDEIGVINDEERGLKADYILMKSCESVNTNIFVLGTPYYNWDNYLETYKFNRKEELSRPIRIESKEILYCNSDAGRNQKEFQSNVGDIIEKVVDLCKKHRKANRKILIFVNNRDTSRELALEIYNKFIIKKFIKEDKEQSHILKQRLLDKIGFTKDDSKGLFEYKEDVLAFFNGIYYHNAGLPEEMREFIENEFLNENGILNIVVSTETLAYGLNSNVDVVIVADLAKRAQGTVRILTVNEYENYVGRSGRLGKSKMGFCYTFINAETQIESWNELKEKRNDPEKLISPYIKIRDTKHNDKMFFYMNFINEQKAISKNQILEKILLFPKDEYSLNKLGLENELDTCLEVLQDRDLIYKSYDLLLGSNLYSLTRRGRNILGYAINIESFDKLETIIVKILQDKDIKIFDLLYVLSDCEELKNSVPNYFTYKFLIKYRKQMQSFLKKTLINNQISKELAEDILNNYRFNRYLSNFFEEYYDKRENCKKLKFKPDINISREEFMNDILFFKHLVIAQVLYMWMHSYSISEIYKISEQSFAKIKFLGEKANYIMEIILLTSCEDKWISAFNTIAEYTAFQESLRNIGISLFYGIEPEVLKRMVKIGMNSEIIEPKEGRRLRLIGRAICLEKNGYTNGSDYLELIKIIKKWPREYIQMIGGAIR